jgi:hypothetical protein
MAFKVNVVVKKIPASQSSSPAPSPAPSTPSAKPKPPNQLWRVLHDYEIYAKKASHPEHGQLYNKNRNWYWREGYPEVFWLLGSHRVPFSEAWQKLSYEINQPWLDDVRWRAVYGDATAFMNGTGFGGVANSNLPYVPRKDYINRIDLNASELPAWDKVRVCGGATISGRDNGDGTVTVDTLNYSYVPSAQSLLERPWYYFHAVSVHRSGNKEVVVDFPQGNGHPVLIPLVAMREVRFPIVALEKVNDIADPYKITYKIP